MRILLITKIFPNAMNPGQAPFNRRQFAALSRYCDYLPQVRRIDAALKARLKADAFGR